MNNIRNYLEEARRLQTTYAEENPEKPPELVGLLEHDPELDDVRGLNEHERDELMAIFKRKERSTMGVLKKQLDDKEVKVKSAKTKTINFELLGMNSFGMNGNFMFSEEFYNYLKANYQVNYSKETKHWVF